jgi:uncharacterized Zn finger protein/superfamily II DNA or RNA helicase
VLKPKRKTYGNTWWGQAWVHALEKIDSARLSRGKSYANTGKVLDIAVHARAVHAQVKGAYYDTYKVQIKSVPFTEQELKIIQALVLQQPSLSIELALGKLPSPLLEMLEQEGIHLLPQAWEDLESRCTCPDLVNPCKHLASVYYLLTNEIDKDPFILFNLKGLSTEQLIGHLKGITAARPAQREQLLTRFCPLAQTTPVEMPTGSSDFNFNFPQRDIHPILSLLSDNPPFYIEGNFKTFLETLYKTVPLAIDQLYSEVGESQPLALSVFQLEFFKDAYSPRHLFQWKITVEPTKKTEKERIGAELNNQKWARQNRANPLTAQPIKLHKDQARLLYFDKSTPDESCKTRLRSAFSVEPADPIFEYFLGAPLRFDFDQGTPSFSFLSVVASLALGLVKARLFLPEVIREAEDTFIIRYIANTQEQMVEAALDQVRAIMPPDICHYGEQFLEREGLADLVAIFITYLVHQALKMQVVSQKDKILTAFTKNYLFRVSRFSEKNIADSITNWLERLHIGKRDIAPQIRIEQCEDDNFQVYVDVINRKSTLDNMIPYQQLFESPLSQAQNVAFSDPSEEVQFDVSRQLMIAAQYMAELRVIVDTRGQEAPVVTLLQMSNILLNTAGILDILGIGLVLPKELKKLAYPDLQVKAKLGKSHDSGASYLSLEGMLDFSYEIALGEEVISPDAFEELVRQSEGLVKFKDQYVLLKADAVQQILQKLKTPFPKVNSPMQALYTAILGRIHGLSFQPDQALERVLSDMMQVEDVAIPGSLNAVLRPYQERGFRWLWSNSRKGLGSCIADDMGLGKTIQVITVLLQAQQEGKNTLPSLVVCPTTLIGNWEKECQRFAPSLRLNIYHGNERHLGLEDVDVLITSYGTFRRDFQQFTEREWQFLIIDEAQNIKNSGTAQTQVIKALKAQNRIAMTGTPVENRLTELWNIFDFINPGYLGSITQFKTRLGNPIEKYQDRDTVEQLKKVTAPFILRRLKTDKAIISDLPDKVTFDEYCYLTKEQAAVYQNVVETIMQEIEDTAGIQRKGLIFKLITALKQICNHPAHFANRGSLASELSGKAAKALSILQAILENKEKALIFTQYREMGNLLQQMIRSELGVEALFFHGGLARKKRDEMVETFQTDVKTRLMIVSLKAGGTGLNLTQASNVIHYDLWWNPAVENQATDRAYRIGQDKKVLVHRLITLGSFEEKIDEMIKAKKALADLTVSNGESWITQMSNQDLREIFSLFNP